ncbi:MAG: methyltransferase domain-containing protein [Phycisphaeraceae bacterium]|nr:methyltransferase domain-containing protein [Phycisphaeraceae bacterium]
MSSPTPSQPPVQPAESASGPAGPVDYASMYQDYWSRPDRWGSHSFADPEPIADQILSVCGGGSVLDVGCGMGWLVRTLLRRGVDARGVDIAQAPVEAALKTAPGRFSIGSILEIPFGDGAVETVVSTDVLEHLSEEDVPRALAELRRVARRFCFVRLAVTPDRDRLWHLTVRDRDWWEARFFEAGFARHPLSQRIVSLEALDDEGWQITLVMERRQELPCPTTDLSKSPVGRDAMHEVGLDAELAIALYTRAAVFVRAGDVVVDASAGAGWGAASLAVGTAAHGVTGLCHDSALLEWARAAYERDGLPLTFQAGSAPPDLSDLADSSVGALVLIDAPFDDARADDALVQAHRVLVPGGRLIIGATSSREAMRATLRDGMGGRFLFERAFLLSGPEGTRSMRQVEADSLEAEARGFLVVLARDVIGADKSGYVERGYPDHFSTPGFNVASYARDLDNPWLLRAMISMGMRSPNRALVADVAQRALDAARPGSADEGGALCVLAYRLLESDAMDADEVASLLDRIAAYHERADGTPHAWRWRISNQFAAGLLLLSTGRQEEAASALRRCAEMDVLPFSPLLASKTIDARYLVGSLEANAGRRDEAREQWEAGLRELERAIKADWLNVWGSPEKPLPFGLPDVGIMLESASRCAHGLNWLDDWSRRPGLAWTWTNKRTLADHRRWIERLENTRDWLDRERGRFRRLAQERERALGEFRDWTQKLQDGREWLSKQRDELSDALRQRDATLGQLREWNDAQAKARAWLDNQLSEKDGRLRELSGWVEKLTEARRWLEGQIAQRDQTVEGLRARLAELRSSLEEQIERRDASITRLRERMDAHEKARSWLESRATARDDVLAKLRARIEEGQEAVRQARARADQLRTTLGERAESNARVRAWADRLVESKVWLEKQLAERTEGSAKARAWLERQLAARDAALGQLRAVLAEKSQGNAKLRQWAEKLAQNKAWLEKQVATRDATIADLRARLAKASRGDARPGQSDALGAMREELARTHQDLAVMRAWADEMLTARRASAAEVSRLRAQRPRGKGAAPSPAPAGGLGEIEEKAPSKKLDGKGADHTS